MAKKGKSKSECVCADGDTGQCCMESMVTVDERGQMVLPKTLRDKAGIRAGDKLTLIGWQKGGKVCCISMIKSDNFAQVLKNMLGPMMKEMITK
ncbi:MAG: HgcAB-associated protein [Candidatus Brocadiia bacterium]